MTRLEEIEIRLAAIRDEIATPGADLEALNAETDSLLDEKRQIQEAAAQRRNILNKIGGGSVGNVIPSALDDPDDGNSERRTLEEVLASPEYESAWAKRMMCLPANKFTEAEKRALGTALTTTATDPVTPTEGADGVNNGGIFMPQNVMDKFMQGVALLSPVFNDINKVVVSGIISLPYKKSQTPAKGRKEGTANTDTEFVWASVQIKCGEISATARISWKLEAMTPDSFVTYVVNELISDHGEQLINMTIYGNTENDTPGIANDTVINGDYDSKTTDGITAIQNGLAAMTAKQKIGAVIYLSTTMSESISFMKDNNGAYIHNPINGTDINGVARVPVKVDPFLKAGDYIIGDLKRNALMQISENVSITKDVSGKQRINDYTSYSVTGVAIKPNSILYGKKTA